MQKYFVLIVLIIAIPIALWVMAHNNFDIRRFASGEPPPSSQPSGSPVPVTLFITTSSIPSVFANVDYKYQVSGYSTNPKSNLSMNVTGLPAGITQGRCITSPLTKTKGITCALSGKTSKVGVYKVRINLIDSYTHDQIYKPFTLNVLPTIQQTCKPACEGTTVCVRGRCVPSPIGPNR